jgi:hypothetical protein
MYGVLIDMTLRNIFLMPVLDVRVVIGTLLESYLLELKMRRRALNLL